MRSALYLVLAACAALAAAQTANPFNNPPGGYNFKAGTPTNLSWKPTSQGTVTLKLQSGGQIDPSTGITIAANIPNSGSFSWTPEANLEDKSDYTIEIINDSNQEYNFLPRFSIAGLNGGASTTAPTAATTTSASTADPTTTTSMMTTTSAPTTTTTSAATATSMMTTTSATKTSSSSAVTSMTSSSGASTKTTGATTTTGASASASGSAAATTVPNANGGVAKNVSGGLMALALAVIAAF